MLGMKFLVVFLFRRRVVLLRLAKWCVSFLLVATGRWMVIRCVNFPPIVVACNCIAADMRCRIVFASPPPTYPSFNSVLRPFYKIHFSSFWGWFSVSSNKFQKEAIYLGRIFCDYRVHFFIQSKQAYVENTAALFCLKSLSLSDNISTTTSDRYHIVRLISFF